MSLSREEYQSIANSIKVLSMDAIQKANSGHPGMPLGCADMAAVLWGSFMVHNPDDPSWPNRDRFVLSAGHGSMLLYSLLHLSGYDLSIDDIKEFRQLHSKTPGHPEHYVTPGVETTTGPLGQGFANGIGMALAARMMAEEFNTSSFKAIDHYIYGIVSDGDIMEGISSEAASLAGHWGLGNVIYLYDSNQISIEGSTDLTFSDNTARRFESYNWHVQEIDGHNYEEISAAIEAARKETSRPSIIIANTCIAKGSPKFEGCEDSHGAPLGDDEVKATKINIGCDGDACFTADPGAYKVFVRRKAELAGISTEWQKNFDASISGEAKTKWDSFFSAPDIDALRNSINLDTEKATATRAASGKVIEALFDSVPNLLGGSADLGPSNKTLVKKYGESGKGKLGRNIHFGIREHAMGAIQNGIAYYGGLIPFSATFLVFMDYMRPAVRIAALGGLHTIYVFTHDSFFVGEDGPTHQPVEHLASARAIPNLHVLRPADTAETVEAWLHAITRSAGPTMLSLTRQNLPPVSNGKSRDLHKGAYVIHECGSEADIVILASGSEVHISIEAAQILEKEGIKARVVSFPSWELFNQQSEEYRKEILCHGTPKAVVEAGLRMGWERYSGNHALFITMENFGSSGPAKELAEEQGFTSDQVAEKIREFLRA